MVDVVVEFDSGLAKYRLIRVDGTAKFVLERDEQDAMGNEKFNEVNTWHEGHQPYEVMVFEAVLQNMTSKK